MATVEPWSPRSLGLVPGVAAFASGLYAFHSGLRVEPLRLFVSLPEREDGFGLPCPSRCGSEEPAFGHGAREGPLLCGPHPHALLGPGASVATAPSSCTFHLSVPLLPLPPTPSPTINENQKGGEGRLERAIPFLFMGLRQRSRGEECGPYPAARSGAGGGGWGPPGLGL